MAKICGVIGQSCSKEYLDELASPMESFRNFQKEYLIGDGFGICRLYLKNEASEIAENRDFAVVFSGYLLNFKKKENYAQEIFKLFSKGKTAFIKDLNGVFNIIIVEKKNKKFYLINDRYGVNSLYYSDNQKTLTFASEVKAVIGNKDIFREIDWEAWRDYFSFRYILGNKTFFKKIKSLQNATILSYEKGRLSFSQYWDYSNIKTNTRKNFRELIEEGGFLVKKAVISSSKDVKNPISFLSGGYDSRCLASALSKYTNLKYETFTTEHPSGKDDPVLAKAVSQKLSIKNTFIKHPKNLYQKYFLKKFYLTDGMAQEHLWALPMSEFLQNKQGVVFDGLAGDLFLKGLFLDKLNLKITDSPFKLSLVLLDQYGYSPFWIKKFFKKPVAESLGNFREALENELKSLNGNSNIITLFFAKNRTRNALSLMSNNILGNLDKRYPFLDNGLVEFGLSVSPKVKIEEHLYVEILKKSFPEVMKIPTSNSKSLLTKTDIFLAEVLTRLKLQRILKAYFKNILFKKSLNQSEIQYLKGLAKSFELPDFINKRAFEKYLNSPRFDFAFFSLIEFLAWYNLFYLNGKLKLE